jgi:uncharacterized protein YjbJ (UPF0337 family)
LYAAAPYVSLRVGQKGRPLVREYTMGGFMFKSSRRDQAEGSLDRLAGRLLEAIGRLTGRRSYQAKGKAARARGAVRGRKGRAKRAVR